MKTSLSGIERGDQTGRYMVARDRYIGDVRAITKAAVAWETAAVEQLGIFATYKENLVYTKQSEKAGLPLATLFTGLGETGLTNNTFLAVTAEQQQSVTPSITEGPDAQVIPMPRHRKPRGTSVEQNGATSIEVETA